AAFQRWWGEWDKGRQEEARRGAQPGKLVGHLLEPLCSLAWAAGRLGVATDTLVAAATTRADVPFDRPLRREATAALATAQPTPPIVTALEGLATGGDPEIRATAAQAVAVDAPARAVVVADHLLSDRVAFNRLASREGAALADTLHKALAQVH